MTGSNPCVVIAGGGTAGHLTPGLAVADALTERGCAREEILFVGSERGLEARLVPESGYEIVLLPGRGVQRRLTKDNVGAIAGLVKAFIDAVGLLRERRPKALLCLGGYASVAAAAAAVLLRIPVVVTEQNASAGLANRIIARFAASVAVPFPETDLPNKVVTGNPVRPAIVDAVGADKSASRRALGLPENRTVIAVFSGSLGSATINTAVAESLASPGGSLHLPRDWRARSPTDHRNRPRPVQRRDRHRRTRPR